MSPQKYCPTKDQKIIFLFLRITDVWDTFFVNVSMKHEVGDVAEDYISSHWYFGSQSTGQTTESSTTMLSTRVQTFR